jgi:hypothetical protein
LFPKELVYQLILPTSFTNQASTKSVLTTPSFYPRIASISDLVTGCLKAIIAKVSIAALES